MEREQEFREILSELEGNSGTEVDVSYHIQGDAFRVEEENPIVSAFRSAYRGVCKEEIPSGTKPFVDDGNTFASLAGIPPITHGPDAKGAHTTNEWVSIDELVRIAEVYALAAIEYCASR